MRVTWNARKAAANRKKHGVSFEEGLRRSRIRLPSRAQTPIIRSTRPVGLPSASRIAGDSSPLLTPTRTMLSGSSAHWRRHAQNVGSMKKAKSPRKDDLRPSYMG
jgi:hypothetical protein